ncbi:MAG TPA: FKBP-type peptidyl-prolyl cis-trans isomerase, partial [Niastella sp.]|nr:FKBP-type peptidyl-prolyl cis-trans isomerase [Niastella sp.]
LIAGFAAAAQTKTTAKKPVAKKTVPTVVLKTLNDSVSYAVGVSAASFYKQQGTGRLNGAIVAKAINDIGSNKKPLLTDAEANECMMRYINQAQQAKSGPNIAKGEAFLATNKGKAGVKTTPSGLQYEVITQGTGPMPTANDTVVCHYRGTLIDGTEFDNSYKRGEPITFPVGGVIRGWTEALQLMPVGSKYKLYIPQQLAYGPNDYDKIPGGSVLIFDVELLEVKGK